MTVPHALRTTRLKGIVFDLDGTLVDGYQGITSGVNAARASLGLPALAQEDVRGRVGLGLSHLMDDVLGPARAVEGEVIFRSVYERVCVEQTRPVPTLVATLVALRARGFRMSVASNKPLAYSIRILERLAVLPMFDTIEGPETAGALKPDPPMIRACLLAMKIRAEEAVYVGDMVIDADAGARAGLAVVLVSGGSCSPEQLRDTGHPVLGALSELLDVLPPEAAG